MPDDDLTGSARRTGALLAELLSDPQLVGAALGEAVGDRAIAVRSSAPRADVAVHLARMDAFDLERTVDARDPLVRLRRQLTPALRDDLAAVEESLFAWLAEDPGRPAQFAHDPAGVFRTLPGIDPARRERVTSVLPPSGSPASRMSGLVVGEITVDTTVADHAVTPSHDPTAKATTAADAVFELGLDQLARVLDGEMVPGIRRRASQLSFQSVVAGQPQQGVLSLLLEDASDPRLALDPASPADTLVVTIGFPEVTIQLGPGPLANAVPANVGAVEVRAQLKLAAQPRADGGGTTVALGLVPGSISVSEPAGLSSLPVTNAGVRQQLWQAATAVVAEQLAPFYAFAVPLTFDTSQCGIGARGVTPAFRGASDTTAPSLALFMTLLDSTRTPPPTDEGTSLVPTGADGHLLLSNGLVLRLACCLLSESEVWHNLPSQPTESDDTCCRWRDIDDVTVGEESFDTLKLLEICVEDGMRMYVDLRKSGWGWDAKVEVTATANLVVEDGVVHVHTKTDVKIDITVAWWLKVIAVLAMIGGLVLIVVGFFKGNPQAIVAGSGLFLLGLGLWTVIHLLPPDIRLPTSLDSAILDLLPGGLRERLGTLSFLTDASWDDIALAGFMTVPHEPPLVAGDTVRLAPGQGLDLDTGDVVSAADVAQRLDVDLILTPGLGDVGVVELGTLARGVPAGVPPGGTGKGTRVVGTSSRSGVVVRDTDVGFRRTLAAFGSSRLVALTGRPYPSVSESDLRSVVFPTTATFVGVPGKGSGPDGVTATVFAARSSAGRLAKGVVWTDAIGGTWVRYRTYDTQLLLTLATNHSVQRIGKPGVSAILTTLNARFQAVPTGAWAGRALTYEWYWQGARINGVATIDGDARATAVDDRCTIDTQQGVDLRGAVCVVARDPGGLAVTACANVLHLGRLPEPPEGAPTPGGSGPGLPGRPGRPGVPGLPGQPGRPA